MSRVSPVFAGRHDELALLSDAMAAESTVLLSGEAGIGKTRLLEAFIEGSRSRVLSGSCVDLGMPFAAFTEAFRPLADEIGQDSAELAALLPELGRPPETDTPEVARARLFEAVLVLMEGLDATREAAAVAHTHRLFDRARC